MTTGLEDNPYKAGPGLDPPYLAGRESEREFIDSTLGFIRGKAGRMDSSPFPPLVLVGPRGVGKTVLLSHAIELAKTHKTHIAKVSCGLLSGPEDVLANKMFPPGWFKEFLGRIGTVGLSYEGAGVSVGLKDPRNRITSAVPDFLSKRPLLIILDEAHHCEPESLNQLFMITQDCMSARLPLALIIAGTPSLDSLLRKCRATYIERSESLRINTLTQEDAKEALEVPARERGHPLDLDALELLLEWSDNYPYFIQLAGARTWSVSSKRGGKNLSLADANEGLELSTKTREEFYANRHIELVDQDMELHAAQTARIIQETEGGSIKVVLYLKRLMELNNGMERESAKNILRKLQENGFIWMNLSKVEPGIPSLFDYILREHVGD